MSEIRHTGDDDKEYDINLDLAETKYNSYLSAILI